MRITVHNRGPEAASLHVLPQLFLRNTWCWRNGARETWHGAEDGHVDVHHDVLGEYHWYVDQSVERSLSPVALLFTDNETNCHRLYGSPNSGYVKDAFHERVVHDKFTAVNPAHEGTKAAAWYQLDVPAGGSVEIRTRLAKPAHTRPFADFDAIFAARIREADAFYEEIQHDLPDADRRLVQRQAFAGMIWSKQFFYFDVPEWLKGDETQIPPPAERLHGRNWEWDHLNNADIISMPDKWEYPWYAAWDLAFHTIPLALIDAEFAKEQLVLLTREWYMHPNGQMPAYEWAFSDVNPPVHAWATWRVFQIDRKQRGDDGDLKFLERVFHKLMLNFTWWVNRKDAEGRNVFQGGFLGLDNIGVFDRNATLPTGGHIDQADGTSWMAMYALNLMRIALELAQHNDVYEDVATKFFEHFLHIAEAISNFGHDHVSLWDDDRQVLLRRAAHARWAHDCAQGAVDSRAHPAVRRRNARAGAAGACARVRGAARMVPELSPRPRAARVALGSAGPRQAPPAIAAARPSHEEAAGENARRERVPVRLRRARALQGARARALRVQGRRLRSHRALRAGGIRLAAVRRQLQLARPDLVPARTFSSSSRCRSFITTTATISSSNARPAPAGCARSIRSPMRSRRGWSDCF